MNTYELTVVLDGSTSAKKNKFSETLAKVFESLGAKIVKTDEWGVKDLAYEIKKRNKGFYLSFVLEAPAKSVIQIDQKLKMDTDVLRYLIIKV